MSRKIYDDYSYIDPDNLYTYSGTSVLRNNFDEKDAEKARELEYKIVASQSMKLFFNPIEIKSTQDILAVHHFLFKEIYQWAGQYRKVNISKNGNAFMPIQSFDTAETYLNSLISNYHKEAHTRKEIIYYLVEILDNLNYFHPFREGNGRTQREVIRSLALMKGYECNTSIGSDDKIYHLYMDGTVYGDKKILEDLFEEILIKEN